MANKISFNLVQVNIMHSELFILSLNTAVFFEYRNSAFTLTPVSFRNEGHDKRDTKFLIDHWLILLHFKFSRCKTVLMRNPRSASYNRWSAAMWRKLQTLQFIRSHFPGVLFCPSSRQIYRTWSLHSSRNPVWIPTLRHNKTNILQLNDSLAHW
jgi:hypothetical protein